jgi:hypothetical protein
MSTDNEASVIYSGRTLVRARRRFNTWETWNNRLGGGPVLVVRPGSFEVSAPQGMMLNSRDLVIQSIGARMWLDKVGWAGTPLGSKACIRVAGRDQRSRRVELALSPRDGLNNAWQALLSSGVAPRDGSSADPR